MNFKALAVSTDISPPGSSNGYWSSTSHQVQSFPHLEFLSRPIADVSTKSQPLPAACVANCTSTAISFPAPLSPPHPPSTIASAISSLPLPNLPYLPPYLPQHPSPSPSSRLTRPLLPPTQHPRALPPHPPHLHARQNRQLRRQNPPRSTWLPDLQTPPSTTHLLSPPLPLLPFLLPILSLSSPPIHPSSFSPFPQKGPDGDG